MTSFMSNGDPNSLNININLTQKIKNTQIKVKPTQVDIMEVAIYQISQRRSQ